MRPFLTAVTVSAPLAGVLLAGPAAAQADAPGGHGATRCRAQVHGSRSVAVCRNDGPSAVRLRLHIKCRRWWDPAVDSRAVEVDPAHTVVLADRCWKEVRAVWVTLA